MNRGGAKQRRCFDVGFVLVVAASEVLDQCSSLIIIPTSTRVIDAVREKKINILERKNFSKIYIGAIIIVIYGTKLETLHLIPYTFYVHHRRQRSLICPQYDATIEEEKNGGRNRGKMISHVRANAMTIIPVFIRAPYPFFSPPSVPLHKVKDSSNESSCNTKEEKKIGAQLAIRIYITWDSLPTIKVGFYTVRLNLYTYTCPCVRTVAITRTHI
uniref:Uncharacterized protein n=1 Tax=Trichogramma kaykai TaxID=54128 RepID=A0ABD2VR65_9HYME